MEAVTIDTIKQEYLDRLKRNLIYQGTEGFSKIENFYSWEKIGKLTSKIYSNK